ncbi:MAG TPA: hypothetical protein VG712_07730 [Gemmatimonadales bacterium]|nr:hypothetical protein [Gemmatimonadales bacterium]
MTDTTVSAPTPDRRRRVVFVAVALVAVAALWWVSELYTTDAARACRELYAGARSAADTGWIDLVVPAAGRTLSEPRACVYYKR